MQGGLPTSGAPRSNCSGTRGPAGRAARDLGSVVRDVQKIADEYKAQQTPGNTIAIRGQAESMRSAFERLAVGILFAAVLVYLLLVNFHSWTDLLVIVSAPPGALAGIVFALLGTKTTFNVSSLMGAIMTIGVATANSTLLVTFANDRRKEGADALTAALGAGHTRVRPVLMTAPAMMGLGGGGEGGEQNAPLGRAVGAGRQGASAACEPLGDESVVPLAALGRVEAAAVVVLAVERDDGTPTGFWVVVTECE